MAIVLPGVGMNQKCLWNHTSLSFVYFAFFIAQFYKLDMKYSWQQRPGNSRSSDSLNCISWGVHWTSFSFKSQVKSNCQFSSVRTKLRTARMTKSNHNGDSSCLFVACSWDTVQSFSRKQTNKQILLETSHLYKTPYFPPELLKGFVKPTAATAVTPTYLFSVRECSWNLCLPAWLFLSCHVLM